MHSHKNLAPAWLNASFTQFDLSMIQDAVAQYPMQYTNIAEKTIQRAQWQLEGTPLNLKVLYSLRHLLTPGKF